MQNKIKKVSIVRTLIIFVFVASTLSAFAKVNSSNTSSAIDNSNLLLSEFTKTIDVSTQEACEMKEGYWYSNTCWANYNDYDEGITKDNVDRIVEEQVKAVEKFKININNEAYPIDFFFIEYEDKEFMILSLFNDHGTKKSILLSGNSKDLDKDKFSANAIIFDIDYMTFSGIDPSKHVIAKGDVTMKSTGEGDDQIFIATGDLQLEKKKESLSLKMNAGTMLMGIGNTKLEIKNNEVYLNGTLGTLSYKQFKELIKDHPEVTTIVLQKVPGSINDAVNMHTGRIIREAGLNTKVLSDSEISSGGVDLFSAGNARIFTKGAQVGIHSWGGGGFSAHQLPKNHPAHQYQIAYFTMCLGEEKGQDFYFRTLEAAPANSMYWMTKEEIEKWHLATQIID